MSALGNKEIMAANIKHYLGVMGISRKEFCNRLGFKYSTVTDWLNAEKYPRIDKIETMANFFRINKSDLVEPHLLGYLDDPSHPMRPYLGQESPSSADTVIRHSYRVPILGRVAAGKPIYACEDVIGYQYIDESFQNDGYEYFALIIKGKSMEPTIMDGDTVIVRKQDYIESGQIAIVLIDGEDATAKEVKETPEGVVLIGHNAAVYQPHFYSRQEIQELAVQIIGRVVQSIRKF
jgi:repressor LexA